jgi:transcriptional regulator with XRE-family HTH domain
VSSNKRPAPHLRIRREAFDRRKQEVFGELTWYEVAERFGVHPSTMSLLRQGHVQPSPPFIADVLRIYGGTFEDWFELADQTQGSAA